MAGKIKEMIDSIIQERSGGNPAIAEMTKAKFILKGLNPNKYDNSSEDDPSILEKLYGIAEQLKVRYPGIGGLNVMSAYSAKHGEDEAAADIKNRFGNRKIKLLVYFASSDYDQARLSRCVQDAFGDAATFGCSTAGEITSGMMLKRSVVAMAFSEGIIADLKVEVIERLKDGPDVRAAFESFERHFNESSYAMDTGKYVGIVLIDGLSMSEEKLMDRIGNRTNVIFIGGSAGDDMKLEETYVCSNGKAYTDSAVLAMLKINDNAEFGIIKTQSFKALDKKLVANKVNEETREVIEFNGKPAILAYTEAVGAKKVEDAVDRFMTNPVGLFVGENDVFIRSPQRLRGTNMQFFCNLLEGMEVRLLESTDIIEDTRDAIKKNINEFGPIDGLINFHCIERTLALEKQDLCGIYGELFKDMPTIGFSTYGEEYIGHINQTSAMLVFRARSKAL